MRDITLIIEIRGLRPEGSSVVRVIVLSNSPTNSKKTRGRGGGCFGWRSALFCRFCPQTLGEGDGAFCKTGDTISVDHAYV